MRHKLDVSSPTITVDLDDVTRKNKKRIREAQEC